MQNAKIRKNTINIGAATYTTVNGLYATDCDSSFEIRNNKVNISNSPNTVYGMFITNSDGSDLNKNNLTGNDIVASTGNTGAIYGLWLNASPYINVCNNTIAINTSAANAYGMYNNNSSLGNYLFRLQYC